MEPMTDGIVKNSKTPHLSLRAKRSNLLSSQISVRLPRRFAPRNDGLGLFPRPSIMFGMKSSCWILVSAILIALFFPTGLLAEPKALTIIHTNDLHSHCLGFSPNIDYSPLETGNDRTVGGFARIATVIKQEKGKRNHPVLVLDAGDFLMGTLFHMLSREESFELRLMGKMGYDVTTLGNHEFDLKPDGLARIITSAVEKGKPPQIVFSNAIFSQGRTEDDSLEGVFLKGLVKPYIVLERGGLRIGIFGLLGKRAAQVAPFAAPLTFKDPVIAARDMVAILREKEKVDLVVCLSHCGLREGKEASEDEKLVAAVPGIDVVIGGHTHTTLSQPIAKDGSIIVQAGSYGRYVGVLDLSIGQGPAVVTGYRLVPVDDAIQGDGEIQALIDSFVTLVDEKVLKPNNLRFYQVIAKTTFDLDIGERETNLGNLIADSIRWAVNRTDQGQKDPSEKVALAVESLGLIRDPLLKGRTGNLAVCDAFNAIPLGVGSDDTMGYPLLSFYLYGSEIKKCLEILTSVYPLKGSDYYLHVSGLRFTYNPRRMIFDRVTDMMIGSEEEGYAPLDYSPANKRLYRCAANIYNATFLKIVGRFTWNILDIVPKDRDGLPIQDLKAARVDADRDQPGIQELKEWVGFMEYLRSFSGEAPGLIASIPPKYSGPLGRVVVEPSWNPVKLLRRGNSLTYLALAGIVALALAVALVTYLVTKRKSRAF
jgi:5'-nucleotidase/UDP-sugar diphosphatase